MHFAAFWHPNVKSETDFVELQQWVIILYN